jgi:hypothetical protein
MEGERLLTGDLHITEVKNAIIESMDCGSNAHHYRETYIQLWINESSTKEAKWDVEKMLKILNKVGENQKYHPESEILIEFGDRTTHKGVFDIDVMTNEEASSFNINLKSQQPECKPRSGSLVKCC